MPVRNYSSTVTERTLTASMTSGQTTMQLNSISGLPTFPFTMVIAPDTTEEEIITVTGISSAANTLDVTRAQDGTLGIPHGTTTSGSTTKVRHMITARDLQESNTHINSSVGVHGLTGSVVGTTDSQTLSNKSLTSPTLTGTVTNSGTTVVGGTFSNPTLSGTISNTGTISGGTLSTPALSGTMTLASSASINLGLTGKITAYNADVSAASLSYVANATSNIQNQLNGKVDTPTAWTAYTPAVGGTSSSSGGATNFGFYKQIGKIVYFRINLTTIFGTNFGTTGVTFSLPAGLTPINDQIGNVLCLMSSGTVRYFGNVLIQASSSMVIPMVPSTTAGNAYVNVKSNVPGTWTAGDQLIISGIYEVA